MNKSLVKKMTLLFLILSTFMGLSSKSLMFVWLMMEMNMMLFIPMTKKMNNNLSNSLFKYFIIQSMASMILMLTLILQVNIFSSVVLNMLILMTLWMKMGFFPFNNWYFQISENMPWMMWFLLNTLQKLIPLWILSWKMMNMEMVNLLLMCNSVYSIMEIWNQNSLRWMINCSSLNHFSWMIISFNSMVNYWEIYYFFYILLNLALVKFMKINNWNSLVNFFNNKSLSLNINFSLILMNFMSIPPFINFTIKILIILNIQISILMIVLLMLNIMVIIIYFYFMLPLMSKMLLSKIKKNNNSFTLTNLSLVMLFFSLSPLLL